MSQIESNGDGKAFIGLSLDSKLFTRQWLRYALSYLLTKHNKILFLIADDLLKYTRTSKLVNGKLILDIPTTAAIINTRTVAFEKFLKSEIGRFDYKWQEHIFVKRWSSFSDSIYINILRNLQIAYAVVSSFKKCVDDVALKHNKKTFENHSADISLKVGIDFLLDEVAMCLRITEMGSFQYEYYPSDQVKILSELYNDTFSPYGVSVESLTGKNIRQRIFKILNIDSISQIQCNKSLNQTAKT